MVFGSVVIWVGLYIGEVVFGGVGIWKILYIGALKVCWVIGVSCKGLMRKTSPQGKLKTCSILYGKALINCIL